MEIPVIERGEGWICVEKPSGVSVHNDPGNDLISRLSRRAKWGECLQPVHRLDLDTSGLLLLATDRESLVRLSGVFSAGKAKKFYQALVHGRFPEREGTWDTPLAKQAGGRTDPRGRGKRVAALTRYRVADESPHYTLLDIELFTGRTHQIRRHAKLAGHPVVGDARYGSARAISFLREQRGFFRMGLHACRLEFQDGRSRVIVESPGLPADIRSLLEADRMPD